MVRQLFAGEIGVPGLAALLRMGDFFELFFEDALEARSCWASR
jgi:DNA mismatch repair ATPase MutS